MVLVTKLVAAGQLSATIALATLMFAADLRAETTTGAEAPPTATAGSFPDQAAVAALIEQLGNDRYVDRRAAELALLDRGLEVFDQVDAAASSVDPEVSASCKYVLTQLTVPWARRDDPPEVKQYLSNYGVAEESQRAQLARELAKLPEGVGTPALVRIVRYDTSPQVATFAAIYLLRREDLDANWDSSLAAMLRHESGASVRPTIEWVRALARQIEAPAEAEAVWAPIVEAFRARLDDPSFNDIAQQQYSTLLWNLYRLRINQSDWIGAGKAIDDLVAAVPNDSDRVFAKALVTAGDRAAWPLLDYVLDNHRQRLEKSKDPLYFAAHARWQQGQADEANRLAGAALAAPAPDGGDQLSSDTMQIALRLAQQNHVDWARREFEVAFENATAGSPEQVYACWWLAESFHDTLEDERAAQLLGKLSEMLRNDTKARMSYQRMQQRNMSPNDADNPLPTIDEIFAREIFLQACHQRSQGNHERERELLQKALELDKENADILISSFRATSPDSAERRQIVERIEHLAQTYADNIDQKPESPKYYNQWAWLICSTQGDFDKAIRYSQRSLELRPDEAGYLDTLGRCYFAVGDLENAVKHQRRAVEKEPSMQVLKRQLDEFEAALAAKKVAEATKT